MIQRENGAGRGPVAKVQLIVVGHVRVEKNRKKIKKIKKFHLKHDSLEVHFFSTETIASAFARRISSMFRSATALVFKPSLHVRPSTMALRSLSRQVPAMLVMRRFAHHDHHAVDQPKTILVDELKKRFPGQDALVTKRLDQLKHNHSVFMESFMRLDTLTSRF